MAAPAPATVNCSVGLLEQIKTSCPANTVGKILIVVMLVVAVEKHVVTGLVAVTT